MANNSNILRFYKGFQLIATIFSYL